MTRDLDAVLASIDGALADSEFPDAMRWSPEPDTVDGAPEPFDGSLVWQPPQAYEAVEYRPLNPWQNLLADAVEGRVRIGRVDRVVEREDGLHVEGTLDEEGQRILDQIVAPLAQEPAAPWSDPASSPLDAVRRAAELYRRPRGLPVDHLILDDLHLVDPTHRDEVAREREQVRQRLLDRIAVGFDVPRERIEQPARVEVPSELLRPVLAWRPLTLPEATRLTLQAEQSRQEYDEALRALRELFAPAAEAMTALVESFQRIASEAGLRFSELVDAIAKAAHSDAPIPPPRRLRDEDPAVYALRLRQSRGTGPDRQLQRQHRPRRVR